MLQDNGLKNPSSMKSTTSFSFYFGFYFSLSLAFSRYILSVPSSLPGGWIWVNVCNKKCLWWLFFFRSAVVIFFLMFNLTYLEVVSRRGMESTSGRKVSTELESIKSNAILQSELLFHFCWFILLFFFSMHVFFLYLCSRDLDVGGFHLFALS